MARGGGEGGEAAGRRRGRKSRPSAPMPRDVLVSKKLSWLLRHGADKEGLVLGEGGYARLDAVLRNKTIVSIHTNLAEIKTIVADNDKQRFSLSYSSLASNESPAGVGSQSSTATASGPSSTTATQEADADPRNYLIRANQGHSLAVSADGLLTPLKLTNENGTANRDLPATVVHGTRHDAWPAILKSGGLKSLRRTHVHFATGVPESLLSSIQASADATREDQEAETAPDASAADSQVMGLPPQKASPLALSGMRTTSTILMFLDLRKALNSGLPFWTSENGVVLSEGDSEGLVPLNVFKRAEEKGGRVLLEDGDIVAEADRSRFLSKKAAKPGDRSG